MNNISTKSIRFSISITLVLGVLAALVAGCSTPPVVSGHQAGPPPGTSAAQALQKLNAQHGSVRQPGGWKR